MILRILGASFIALGLGFIIEDVHAGETRLCADGRIVAVAPGPADPCRIAAPRLPVRAPAIPHSVPLPMKRPAAAPKVSLKGPAEAEPIRRGIGALATADPASDFRRVRIINAQPGTTRWYSHTR